MLHGVSINPLSFQTPVIHLRLHPRPLERLVLHLRPSHPQSLHRLGTLTVREAIRFRMPAAFRVLSIRALEILLRPPLDPIDDPLREHHMHMRVVPFRLMDRPRIRVSLADLFFHELAHQLPALEV